jgi:hypothetical protein
MVKKPPAAIATEEEGPLGLRSRAVCDLLGIPSSTLNYWVQIKLVRPSLRGPEGKRVEQYWSVADVVAVRAIRALRRHGATLQQIQNARTNIVRWGAEMSDATLYWDGRDIVIQTADGEFVSALRAPGQRMWVVAALPLGTWYQEAVEAAAPVPIDTLRARAKDRARRRNTDQLERAVMALER